MRVSSLLWLTVPGDLFVHSSTGSTIIVGTCVQTKCCTANTGTHDDDDDDNDNNNKKKGIVLEMMERGSWLENKEAKDIEKTTKYSLLQLELTNR